MADCSRAYMKELYKLTRTVDKLTCGQARIDLDCEKERSFYLLITPDDGYFKGATCKFQVTIPEAFPTEAPQVHCLNRIYHPNIDIDSCKSEVCVNLLGEDWQPGVGLDGCVMAVLYIFHHPNFEDALNQLFDDDPMNELEFIKNVAVSLRGGEVDGFTFDQLLDDGNLAKNNWGDEKSSNNQDKICKDTNMKMKEVGIIENRNGNEYGNSFFGDHAERAEEHITNGNKACKDFTEAGTIENRYKENIVNDNCFCMGQVGQATNVSNQDKTCKETYTNRNDNEDVTFNGVFFGIDNEFENVNIKPNSTATEFNTDFYINRHEQDTNTTKSTIVNENTRYSSVCIMSSFALTMAGLNSHIWHKVLTIIQRFYTH
ncbi:unnamed protein product [Candidula unifasciata]|uniref:UBC core domain-containing protein n=1 Tax=Candidula unifasciata TaxID=100452 RepID=A0A8S3Z298_9EUPU|nr:unnamed protein product [Candidula unifasciata]